MEEKDIPIKIIDKREDPFVEVSKMAYEAGLKDGRNESGLYAIIPMSILENTTLPANAKLLYGEIMALSKKSGKCYATNEHLADMLGLKKPSIPSLLKELAGTGLIIVDIKRSSKGTYRDIMVSFFNDGRYNSTTRGGIVRQRGQNRNRQIEIDKIDNIATSQVAGKEINLLIELFKTVNPSYEQLFKNISQRKALGRMLAKHGKEKIEWAIGILEQTNKIPFSPTITTPIALENKLGDLISFCNKEKIKTNQNKIIKI